MSTFLSFSSHEAISLLFETGSLTGLELYDQVRPHSQGTPGVHLSQLLQHWDSNHIATTSGSFKIVCLGAHTQILKFHTFYFSFCIWYVLSACMSVPCACRGQKRAWNQTQVLWESSQQLSHLVLLWCHCKVPSCGNVRFPFGAG